MKKNKFLSFYAWRNIYKTPEFVFLTGVMICGILAGSFTGLHITDASGQYIVKLSDYVLKTENSDPLWMQILWNLGRDFLYVAVLLLFSGVWRNAYLTGLQIAGKGFMLSFTICAFLSCRPKSILFSFFYTALPSVFLLPAILHLGAIGLLASAGVQGNRKRQILNYRKEILASLVFVLIANGIRSICIYGANFIQ
jgi:hypothetical protein